MLKLQPREPMSIALMGATFHFRAVSRAMIRAARQAVRAHADTPDNADEAADLFSRTLIAQGLTGWDGVGDANGKPIAAPTPETIALLLDDPVLLDMLEERYVVPVLQRISEKNASSPSPAGTGPAGTRAKGTARSVAAKRASGARSARTASTSRKAKKG